MKEIVIFCQSYPQIKIALYLVTQNYEDHSITVVIPGNHDLFKFFELVNEKIFQNKVNIVYFARYPRNITRAHKLKSLFYLIPHIIQERRYLGAIHSEHFSGLKDADIYFFSRHWSDYAFYLLKRLGKLNRLTYIPDPAIDGLPLATPYSKNIYDLAALVVAKLIFSYDITMGKYLRQRFLRIPDNFVQQRVHRIIDRDERDKMLKDFDFGQFQVRNADDFDVVYFDHMVERTMIPADSFDKLIVKVFDMLCRYFPENRIAVKHHPGHHTAHSVIKKGVVIDKFIPAEFLFSSKVRMYLSPYSTSLAGAGNVSAVSLLELISFGDDHDRQQLRADLIGKSGNKVIFPKTLEEFEEILINLTQQTN